MNPSRRALLAGLASSGLLALPRPGRAGAPAKPLNILVISSDEHNPDFFSHLGHQVSTPNLDRLRADSMSLERVYTSTPICAPTRASFLTSTWPQQHGQINNSKALDSSLPTMAGFFSDQGYETVCYGKLHTNTDEGLYTFGFDDLLNWECGTRWDDIHSGYRKESTPTSSYDSVDAALYDAMPDTRMKGRVLGHAGQHWDYTLVGEAKKYLAQDHAQPFLLYVSFINPHYPFSLPGDFYYQYDRDTVTLPSTDHTTAEAISAGAAKSLATHGWGDLTDAQQKMQLARYMGCVSFLDWMVGELLDALELAGLADDTLVVYLSDHGDMAASKGLWLKSLMYEGVTRKPMYLRLPGVTEPGSSFTDPVNEVDILPTLAGMVGLGTKLPREQISGRDLSQPILHSALGGDPLMAAAGLGIERQHTAFSHLNYNDAEPWMTMVVAQDLKYIRYYDGDLGGVYDRELYDLGDDPNEDNSLADDPAANDLMDEMDALIDEHLASLAA